MSRQRTDKIKKDVALVINVAKNSVQASPGSRSINLFNGLMTHNRQWINVANRRVVADHGSRWLVSLLKESVTHSLQSTSGM